MVNTMPVNEIEVGCCLSLVVIDAGHRIWWRGRRAPFTVQGPTGWPTRSLYSGNWRKHGRKD